LTHIKCVFVSYLDSSYSRTSVYLSGPSRNDFFFWQVKGNKLRKFWSLVSLVIKHGKGETIFVVMSPCHSLVIPLRFLTFKKIVLDAGWSHTEALQARFRQVWLRPRYIFTYFMDFLSFHLSNICIFESELQCLWIRRRFLLRSSKAYSLFTGFNESMYQDLNPTMPPELCNRLEFQKSYILFRGSFTNEAGLNILRNVTQSRHCLKLKFIIATNVRLKDFDNCKNVIVIERFLLESEIKYLYLNCVLTLGQLRWTNRLMNTVPHKAFEAAYFGRPYMTRDASGIREFLKHEETAIFVDTETPEAVARILHRTLTDKNFLERTGNLAKIRYDQVARQEKLQNKFMAILRTVTRS